MKGPGAMKGNDKSSADNRRCTDVTSAREYLSSHNVLCLATATDDTPWVSPVFYAVHADKLVFLSAPHTRHAKNIDNNPIVSASVQNDYSTWQDIKGVQLQGRCALLTDTSDVIKAYSSKFPVTGADAPPQIAKALDKIGWYELTIELFYFIDNSKGLGYRVELDSAQVLKGL